jgi:hypothetical protein
MANILNIQNGVVASGSVTFPNLADSNTATKVVLQDSTGKLFTTASSAIGGGGNVTNNYYNTSSFIATGSVTASVNVNDALFQINSSSTTFMFVSSSGNIGIGTTTPTFDLQLINSKRIYLATDNSPAPVGLVLGGYYNSGSANFTGSRNYSIIGNVSSSANIPGGTTQNGDIIISPRNTTSNFNKIVLAYTGSDGFGIRQSFGYASSFISGTLLLPDITTGNFTNVVVVSATGQLYYTASSAIGGGGGPVSTVGFITTGSTGTSQSITGSLTVSGSLTVTGSLNAPNITGSLLGTSSWAFSASQAIVAVTSSYPLSVSGSTLYSVYNSAPGLFNVTNNILIGNVAGASASNASSSNFLGYQAGWSASNADNSTFMGYEAGFQAINARNSVIIGQQAGKAAQSASFSTLIGYKVGNNPTDVSIGSNNIIIGTNITLPKTASNSINIGGILFGTGSYSTTTGNPFSGSVMGKVGINIASPTYSFQVSGTVGFPNLANSSTAAKVVLLDNSGQLWTTASSAFGGGSTTPVPTIKASASSAASFTGTPLMAQVSFSAYFADTNYAVTVTGEDPRAWSIQTKASTGFVINSNSSVALTGPVYWIATPYSNS